MFDDNGRYTQLTFDDALSAVLANAAAAGVSVPAGSVEEQLADWMAQEMVDVDNAIYAAVVKQFNPTGSDIDIQNPGFPRLLPVVSKGFLQIVNNTAGVLAYPLNTIFTAPNGNTYTNPVSVVTISPGNTGFLSVESSVTGAAQNLPQDLTFTNDVGGVVTNPQPVTGGADLETDTAYLNRLNNAKSNNTSQQATDAAKKEFLEFYQDAAIFVNSSNNGLTLPVPIPPQGLNIAVILDSGVNAGPEEIQNAIRIITNRFEFGNLNNLNSSLHPIIQGSSFAGVFPQAYSITVGQAVISTVDVQINVSFPSATLAEEKPALAQAYATAFVQRLINLLSGASGTYNFTFVPYEDTPVSASPSVLASAAGPVLGPFVSVEAVRALVSGGDSTGNQGGINLLSLGNLSIEFDPDEYEQNPIILSIFAPYEGTLEKVDFILDSLFTDGTSWYDRYIFLDPTRITVSVVES